MHTNFDGSDDIANIYEESPPFLDAICHPYPATDVDFPPQEVAYEDEEFPSNGFWNWQSEYYSSFGYCWGDNLFLNGYNSDDNVYDSSLQKKEDSHPSEEQCDSYINYFEDADKQPDYHYNFWSSCGSWFGDGGEEPYNYSRQEGKPTNCYSLDEIRLCEAIFGYWPCLLQGQKSYC